MKRTVLLLVLGLAAGLVRAQPDPAEAARAAIDQLEAASLAMQEAEKARDRVAALTDAVRAYEAGLTAVRDSLRQASIREAQLGRELAAQEKEVARLLGALMAIGDRPTPASFVHPAGPTGTARAGMILAEITPALESQAARLRQDLEEVAILRGLQQGAAETLQTGLSDVQQARTELSQAIADRTDLPRRFVDDPVKTALIIASTETLESFASALTGLEGLDADEISLPDISERRGALPLPVESRVLRRAGEADAAGVRRPGLVLATRPNALVTSPTAATIRYRGPLLDYGNVMILEPQPGLLFVFAGLGTVFGEAGQVIPQGSPVGLMGGSDPEIGAILSQSGEGTGNDRTETLYIEVRQDETAVDPETWFRTDKDG